MNHYNISNVYSMFPSTETGQMNPLTNNTNNQLNSGYMINGNNMMPSPEYENRVLNSLLPLANIPNTTLQIAIPETKPLSLSLKQENSDNDEERIVVIPPEHFLLTTGQFERNLQIDNNNDDNYNSYDSSNNIICPPTPTTPNNERLMLNCGWMDPQLDQIELLIREGKRLLRDKKFRSHQRAFECFMKAASLGSQKGKHQVAYCLQHGFGVSKNETKAVEIYMEIANSRNPISASFCQLGICFQMGIGVPSDPSHAISYYERAVVMGDKDAMFNLAYCLRLGIGTAIDYQRAYNLYLQLAQLGDPQGMKLVGNCKLIGLGTNRDEKEALEWLRYSSESNVYWGGKVEYALILLNLGNDNGTTRSSQNHREAFELLRSVCESFPTCHGTVKLLFGKCHHSGVGCEKNLTKALYWYQEAIKSRLMPLHAIQECQNLIGRIRYNNNNNNNNNNNI